MFAGKSATIRSYHLSTTLASFATRRLAIAVPSILRTNKHTPIVKVRPYLVKSAYSTMAPITAWKRLIRYVSAQDGKIHYGEPVVSDKDDIDALAQKGGLKVKILEGATAMLAKPTGEEDEVKTLLGPLTSQEVPLVRCIGLNYKTHILETGFDLPENPTIFHKSSETVADTRQPTPIPKLGQSTCDYEGELTIVIGKDALNVSPENALDYVAGYVSSNDVSCRDWQMDKSKAGMMPQWCFSKSFDKYAPLGPAIVSTAILGDAKGLELVTRVNGEERQRSNTDDLCFGVKDIVSFCSTGQTLKAGSLIMTGTPGGVGIGMKPQPKYLKDGDEVSVEISGIGKVVTAMKFQ